MGQISSFTSEQRALWHRARHLGVDPDMGYSSEELDEVEGDRKAPENVESLDGPQGASCLLCGASIQGGLQPGYEAGLCSACE